MLVKKYQILKIENVLVIENIHKNYDNNNYYNDSINLNINFSILSNKISTSRIVPVYKNELNIFDYKNNNNIAIFDTEREAIKILEPIIYTNTGYNEYSINYIILPILVRIDNIKDIRKLKLKELFK